MASVSDRQNALIDRQHELVQLEQTWVKATAGRPQLAMVWGRRRVGKTFLLAHFVRGKRAVFFGATQQAEVVELARLAEAVRRDLGPRVADLTGGSFSSWEAALRFFVALAADDPLIVVLDEVPYLTRSTAGFASIVQAVWDHVPPGTKLCLILTGSAVGVIEEMLGARAALRGRPTLTMRLDPLGLAEARAFLPHLAPVPFFEAYAACGGYPLHLLEWESGRDTGRNLGRLAATPGGILLEDAWGILREELPETGAYARILSAVGRGRTRYSEIAGEAEQRIDYPLDVLTRAGFLRKVLPVGAPKAARPAYEIADAYLSFWFGVLYSHIPEIEAGQGRAVLRRVEPLWQRHLGRVFEESARLHAQHLVHEGTVPALPDDLVIGRWWSTARADSGGTCEVDVLGLRGKRSTLLGEARWQSRPLDLRDLESLRRKITQVPDPAELPVYALWGRFGVTDEVRQAGALGFSLEDMLGE